VECTESETVGNGRIYRDDTGEVFPTRDAALMHATRLATELADDTAWNNFWITVTDEQARKIARIPVRL
jgi:hypothetical protein